MPSLFTPDQRAQYERDGYLIIRSLFDTEEIALMRDAIEQDPALRASLYDRKDAEGKSTRMALWNHPGDSVYGLAARSRRVVDTMEDMLGGEVYHYHSKLTAKEPYDGGAWEWHQDYGYWYHNGCMYPYMGSVMVALDRANRDNGCLQVLRGSHLAGRVDHGVLPGEQVGADLRRVEEMKKQLELVYVELEPGDGLFFHANVMHRSDQNRSPNRRWTVLFCFNAARNNPYVEHHHPQYTPLRKVDDAAVRAAGARVSSATDGGFATKAVRPAELTKQV
ncbi:MAG: phytanoyl-CoA dioxygenase family protein [Rhodoferax sp.]|jgi:ectoine hydroxylase|nr:phytanoyl-CoA dioxygenase family protein [Rhodoferax sp.]MBP9929681.1 phytanoyl-CoA dioxygenase family protein [Rhodoferax sp.]HQX58948.1 phytanoyl-CoA dioxygenase family protein [Burkholderiaceae bacterium]HQZ06361.1 phytanoyl-CoA dioxygenase family protein [Burkholderiaceae bacterium]HRA63197.1 phytanoyl-CoA dioxygenase family protein [Burkholderiaceae bacterium]